MVRGFHDCVEGNKGFRWKEMNLILPSFRLANTSACSIHSLFMLQKSTKYIIMENQYQIICAKQSNTKVKE